MTRFEKDIQICIQSLEELEAVLEGAAENIGGVVGRQDEECKHISHRGLRSYAQSKQALLLGFRDAVLEDIKHLRRGPRNVH